MLKGININHVSVLTGIALVGTFVAYITKGQVPSFFEQLDVLLVGATAGIAQPTTVTPVSPAESSSTPTVG